MKRITVYNEKGGCGKTTVTILLASFLASEGHRVAVLDFDAPIYHASTIREEELRDLPSFLTAYLKADGLVPGPGSVPYGIRRMEPRPDGSWDGREIADVLSGFEADGTDYLLCDFPGRYSDFEPVSMMARSALLDFAAVPVEADPQTMKSALVIADTLGSCGVKCSLFWNRIPGDELDTQRLRSAEEVFASYGMDFIPERMRLAKVVSHDSRINGFLRSTMCFPRRNTERGGWLMPFLGAVKERIGKP